MAIESRTTPCTATSTAIVATEATCSETAKGETVRTGTETITNTAVAKITPTAAIKIAMLTGSFKTSNTDNNNNNISINSSNNNDNNQNKNNANNNSDCQGKNIKCYSKGTGKKLLYNDTKIFINGNTREAENTDNDENVNSIRERNQVDDILPVKSENCRATTIIKDT
ncbi:hypothetical protein GQX74_007989 [Glossina fuscipes]|nr:hypothetical protein GQX74_007989 [Glossina fuscipes]